MKKPTIYIPDTSKATGVSVGHVDYTNTDDEGRYCVSWNDDDSWHGFYSSSWINNQASSAEDAIYGEICRISRILDKEIKDHVYDVLELFDLLAAFGEVAYVESTKSVFRVDYMDDIAFINEGLLIGGEIKWETTGLECGYYDHRPTIADAVLHCIETTEADMMSAMKSSLTTADFYQEKYREAIR